VIFDGIVLAGGRSSRLGGVPKATLEFEGATLVARTVDALHDARRLVVVGDPALAPPGVLHSREHPAFGGPAAALRAGFESLDAPGDLAPHIVVLACDMPHASDVVRALLAAQPGEAVIPIDADGRLQHLAARYESTALRRALDRHGDADGASVRELLEGLAVTTIALTDGSTRDIDTWDDADHFGIARPTSATTERHS
jgi:molybdopterin-guanine dinucleotide biosynthesis protein A